MSRLPPRQAASTAAPHAASAPVPAPYRGVWRRLVLEQAGRVDDASLVHWLQTRHWHADLRIPPARPDFSGLTSLHDCDDGRLAWLAGQQGFCGTTEVRGARCLWRRRVDFQPDGGRRDIGQMAFNGDRLIEVGAEADYLEVWHRLPGGTDGQAVLELAADAGRPPGRRTWLLVAGDRFAYVRARAGHLPPAASLAELVAARQPDRAQLVAWLDFEISMGRRGGPRPWRIDHSTLPFREGACPFPDGPPRRVDRHLAMEGEGPGAHRWAVLEWHLDHL